MATPRCIHRRLMVQHSTATSCLCSEDHFVYTYVYRTKKLQRLFQLPLSSHTPAGRIKDVLRRSRFVRSFSKNIGIHNVVELPTGTILAFYDNVYRYAPSSHSGIAEATLSFQRGKLFAPLKNGIAVNPENNCAYFGEYQNSRPYAAKIMRLFDDGKKAEICHTFPEGKVKHIHSITWDPFRKRLWIATGDNNLEAGLYYTDDDFRSVSYFNGGSQTWRMVSLLPTRQFLYWGSDAGQDATAEDKNFIFRWDFEKKSLEKISYIGNPAYYSAFLDDGGMLIGTTYEPGMKQKTEPLAVLWYSADGEQWKRVASLPYKDARRTYGTRYATINLPKGILPRETVLFTPLNTQKWDFDLLTIQV